MRKSLLVIFIITTAVFISCKKTLAKHNQKKQETSNKKSKTNFVDSLTIYQSKNLIIKKLSNHVYEHVSFLNTDTFGKVSCNGMLIINENKGIIFDTPTDNKSSLELINFVTNKLKSKITALIPTHFHKDCIGGIQMFEEKNIPTYASNQTIALLKTKDEIFTKPINKFNTNLTLEIGNKKVYAAYFGEGHTKDNIIGYFAEDKVLFGGCLIKKVNASKGNLEDANANDWSETVRNIKLKYPDTKIVIPGHGKHGGTELLDYTINLFDKK
ncbi:subclass B1 metallo-beta-lactamase [Tenacibaculum ovolyticum]|uniref:subclass B1 metallo-beta-lactamase n=1 Tax=Tenacibaculum ovolyticum TaxID=104270 RepID=UPI0007EDBAA1|nr:subclass B1 metallo-beta-lactamase [Tenacibaculum ovolyticum]WBX75784.1 subclass B1 metallo-beta-lactamase [Tenacibaculum ovolyticum]